MTTAVCVGLCMCDVICYERYERHGIITLKRAVGLLLPLLTDTLSHTYTRQSDRQSGAWQRHTDLANNLVHFARVSEATSSLDVCDLRTPPRADSDPLQVECVRTVGGGL